MIPNTRTLVRLWAAIMSDAETVIARFCLQDGWRYTDFGAVARKMRISLMMNLTVGQGKLKEEYYDVVFNMILQVGRAFWLQEKEATSLDRLLDMKRRLGGLYFVFTVLNKAPLDRGWLLMDRESLHNMMDFITDLKIFLFSSVRGVRADVMFMMACMSEKMNLAAASDTYGADGWRRSLMTMQKHEVARATMRERKAHDLLGFAMSSQMMTLVADQHDYMKQLMICILMESVVSRKGVEILSHLDVIQRTLRNNILPSMDLVMRSISDIADKPLFTLEQLTLDQIVERRVMKEHRLLIERCRKRILEGPQKPKSEYVRVGSIWGRKKGEEEDEGKGQRQRRERGGFARNLLVFMKNLPFDYEFPEDEPPTSQENQNGPTTTEKVSVPSAQAAQQASSHHLGPMPMDWQFGAQIC